MSAVLGVCAPAAAQRSYANPIDIDYRYNFEQAREGVSYRTGADPVVVRHKGRFYLFQTLADGYWVSDDLIDWRFVTPSRWPFDGMVAPAAWSDGDWLYLMQSGHEPKALLASDDPASGRLDFVMRPFPPLPDAMPIGQEDRVAAGRIPPGPWDPQFFSEADRRWYLYWGSSNLYPLYGIALDRGPGGFAYRGKPRSLVLLDPARHGWHRFGQDHSGRLANGTPIKPFIEGAWMSRIAGRYYLQYGAPGTEYNAYATGLAIGDAPLGPFREAAWSPIGYKPGGFVTGAGHGSTFQDAHGNWWLTGTPWIGHNWTFERRIGMWPMRLWPDGEWSADTRFGDWPHRMPRHLVGDPTETFLGWMLLSYRKPMRASSTLGEFAASRAADEDPRSFWVARRNRPGETLTIDLNGPRLIHAVQVNFADYKSGRYGDAPDIYTEFRIEASADGKTWREVARTEPPRRDRPNAYLEIRTPIFVRFVRYVHGHVGAAHLAISDLRVFGKRAPGSADPPEIVSATRHADQRDATIRWRPVPGAVGYNIRWGIRPDRLTQTYQRWHDQGATLELRALTVGQRYHVAVETFDEDGVSPLSATLAM